MNSTPTFPFDDELRYEKKLLKMFTFLWDVEPKKANLATLQKPKEDQLGKADGFPWDEELADVK